MLFIFLWTGGRKRILDQKELLLPHRTVLKVLNIYTNIIKKLYI